MLIWLLVVVCIRSTLSKRLCGTVTYLVGRAAEIRHLRLEFYNLYDYLGSYFTCYCFEQNKMTHFKMGKGSGGFKRFTKEYLSLPWNMFWCIDCKVRHGQRAWNMNEACQDQVSRVPIKLFLHFSIFVRPLSGKMHRFTLIKGWPTSKMWIQNEAKKLHSLISEQLSLVLWGLPNERLIHNHILSMKWVLTYQGAIV